MRRAVPDWLLQISWFAAALFATGAFWYFLSQKNYWAVLWAAIGTVAFVLMAVTLHIYNDVVRRKDSETPQARGFDSSNSTLSDQPTTVPTKAVSFGSSEVREAEIASSDDRYSPMTMEEYFEAWFRTSTTSLQRNEVERRMKDRRVIWNGLIKTIEEKSDGRILVTVAPVDGSYGTAFLYFETSQRSELTRLNEKQRIRFTGIIRSFVASPFLSDCGILQVLP